MRILALDTATSACSVALLNGDQTLSRFELAERSHTQKLMPMIDDLLQEMGLQLNQLDAIAFTHGPGSFTGIRIGFAAVQGLAMGAKLPVVPISTLQLMAATASRKLNLQPGTKIYPLLDARMNELYVGHYRLTKVNVDKVADDQLVPVSDSFIADAEIDSAGVGVGDGWVLLPETDLIEQVYPDLLPEAEDILPIATANLANAKLCDIRDIEPLYLRDRVSWQKRKWLRDRQN